MTLDKGHLVSKIKEKTKIQYHDKILKEGKEIKAEWMTNPQKPENLVGDIFFPIKFLSHPLHLPL